MTALVDSPALSVVLLCDHALGLVDSINSELLLTTLSTCRSTRTSYTQKQPLQSIDYASFA